MVGFFFFFRQLDCSLLSLNANTLLIFTDAHWGDRLQTTSDLKSTEGPVFLLPHANELKSIKIYIFVEFFLAAVGSQSLASKSPLETELVLADMHLDTIF